MRGRTRRLYEKALAGFERGEGARARKGVEKKKALSEEIKKVLSASKSFVVVSAEGMPAPQFLEIKKRLEARGLEVRTMKGRIFVKAARELGLAGVEKLEPLVSRPSIFVFSKSMNVFELGDLVRSTRAYRKAKPGDRADAEIVIPAGPTGIPPGPMISVFGRLKIPVQPRGSEIHVIRDTVVAKPGQEIGPDLASLLAKLGITPFTVSPKVVVGYEGGLAIPGDQLVVDVEGARNMIREAVARGLAVSLELVLPEPQILGMALRRAQTISLAVSLELGLITPENAGEAFRRAVARAIALAGAIQRITDLGIQVQAPAAEERKEEPQKQHEKAEGAAEERKEASEEEIAEGISSLFG